MSIQYHDAEIEVGDAKLRVASGEYGITINGVAIDAIPVQQLSRYTFVAKHGADADVPVYVEPGDDEGEYTVYVRGEVIRVSVRTARDVRLRALRSSTTSAATTGHNILAPMPGMIKRVFVDIGDAVEKGTTLCILEAMKMENEIKSPSSMIVKRVVAVAGSAVEKSARLFELQMHPGDG